MTEDEVDALAKEWLKQKGAEARAKKKREEAETKLANLLKLQEGHEGTTTKSRGEYVIKVTQKLNRKIDADALKQLVEGHGILEQARSLFSWSPSLSLTAWRLADDRIRKILSPAITEKPGKPSFKIEQV